MHVIPVLDLKGGAVVLASGGRRDAYQPINTPLCPNSSPALVVDALLGVFPFDIFYIADLDAIGGAARNAEPAQALARAHPGIEFWLDAGFADVNQLAAYAGLQNLRFVVGSESLASIADYRALCEDPRMARHILSLDRKDDVELGPQDLIHRSELWPDTVISMDLTRVGAAKGPDLDRIRALRGRRADLNVVAAGGVRDIEDLLRLAADGVTYALVATALHHQKLHAPELERLSNMQVPR